MLCPEVWDFPPPKVYCTSNKSITLESVQKFIKMNDYYQSIIVTCPDTTQMPSFIKDTITEDSVYYRINNCSLMEIIKPIFINTFVKNGYLYCLSSERNCVIQNCFAVTPEGILILHILEHDFQTLGFEGHKRPHNYYEVSIKLKEIKNYDKIRQSLKKLGKFDFDVIWEPTNEDICPSTIAKYFYELNYKVTAKPPVLKTVSPTITEIPSVSHASIDELVEWTGILAHNGNLSQHETYISTYCPPESERSLHSTNISVIIVEGYFSPTVLQKLCNIITDYVKSRDLDDYWASISIQSCNHSYWRWNYSSPKMFQSHDSSCNIFFSHENNMLYSIGQLIYS